MSVYATCAHEHDAFDPWINVFKGLTERSDGSFLPQWRAQERMDDENILQSFNIKKNTQLSELRQERERAAEEKRRQDEIAAKKAATQAKRNETMKRKAAAKAANAAKKPRIASESDSDDAM